jgi:hypothetical protein
MTARNGGGADDGQICMRSVIPQGLAVGAETWGIRPSGICTPAAMYNHGPAMYDFRGPRKLLRNLAVVAVVRRIMANAKQSQAGRALIVMCNERQHTRSQCAGIEPKERTSVAKKDSAARSSQLGRLRKWGISSKLSGTGRAALASPGLLGTSLFCNSKPSATRYHHAMQEV